MKSAQTLSISTSQMNSTLPDASPNLAARKKKKKKGPQKMQIDIPGAAPSETKSQTVIKDLPTVPNNLPPTPTLGEGIPNINHNVALPKPDTPKMGVQSKKSFFDDFLSKMEQDVNP